MGFSLNAVTQEKFEVQRATVKNEKDQNYDHKPQGQQFEAVAESLYTQLSTFISENKILLFPQSKPHFYR
tara:strand:+ start:801 stop:1010 length:210 start_codon:yes stop_codon:yes gene_type:complete